MRASAEAARCACAVTRREFRKYPGRRGITNRTDAGEDLGGDAESAEVTDLGLTVSGAGGTGSWAERLSPWGSEVADISPDVARSPLTRLSQLQGPGVWRLSPDRTPEEGHSSLPGTAGTSDFR